MTAPEAGSKMGRRRRHLRGISFNVLVPNMITVMSLCSGMTGIRFALEGNWRFAVGAIAIASVLDTLDGRMARLLKGASRFGAELDSFADFIAFGVAPAVIMYLWATSSVSLGWAAALFFATCMALRLARFNIALDEDDAAPFAAAFFKGTPAPAAAGIAMLPLLLSIELGDAYLAGAWAVAFWMTLAGLLMVSTVPTFSFKRLKMKRRHALLVLIFVVLVLASLAAEPWLTLSGIVLAYLLSIPFSWLSYRRQEAAWRLHATDVANNAAIDREVAVDDDGRSAGR